VVHPTHCIGVIELFCCSLLCDRDIARKRAIQLHVVINKDLPSIGDRLAVYSRYHTSSDYPGGKDRSTVIILPMQSKESVTFGSIIQEPRVCGHFAILTKLALSMRLTFS
jgi:hypothetical protein